MEFMKVFKEIEELERQKEEYRSKVEEVEKQIQELGSRLRCADVDEKFSYSVEIRKDVVVFRVRRRRDMSVEGQVEIPHDMLQGFVDWLRRKGVIDVR